MPDKKYIDAEILLAEINGYENTRADRMMSEWYSDMVTRQPAADVAEVKSGEWISYRTDSWRREKSVSRKYYRCNMCQKSSAIKSNYCPKCGARMDGDKNADNV